MILSAASRGALCIQLYLAQSDSMADFASADDDLIAASLLGDRGRLIVHPDVGRTLEATRAIAPGELLLLEVDQAEHEVVPAGRHAAQSAPLARPRPRGRLLARTFASGRPRLSAGAGRLAESVQAAP